MTHQSIRKNPFEDQIIEETAENVAEEMIAEIRDEVAVWVVSVYMLQSTCTSITVLQYVCVVGLWMSFSFLSKWPKAVEYKAAP
jgi:hypothetical protein